MSARPKILVTSASGKTGAATALQLLEKEFPVRASRRLDQRFKKLEAAGAEVFVGEQYSLTDMRAAMTDAAHVNDLQSEAPGKVA